MAYSQDDFLGYATLAGDSPAGEYEVDLRGGAFATFGGKTRQGTLKVRGFKKESFRDV